MPLYNVVVRFHLEYCMLLWSYMFRWDHVGRKAGRIECENFLRRTERLLLACFSNRKTEKPVLLSKSVQRCLLHGMGREVHAGHIYQNMRVPEESSTKYDRDKHDLSCWIQ